MRVSTGVSEASECISLLPESLWQQTRSSALGNVSDQSAREEKESVR